MRLSSIVTKRGDSGQTDLAGGGRVPKSCQRVEAFGTIDELLAHIGMIRTIMGHSPHHQAFTAIAHRLQEVQDNLFDVGSDLASLPDAAHRKADVVHPDAIAALETELDDLNQELPELRSFVLPGGGELNAWTHLARTVCRRAERESLRLSEEQPVRDEILCYLNRLSDYLFVLSRWFAKFHNEAEFLWKRPLAPKS